MQVISVEDGSGKLVLSLQPGMLNRQLVEMDELEPGLCRINCTG